MDMASVVVRYVEGYLLQVGPCAVLCLLPFAHALKYPLRRVVARACLAIAATCAIFVLVSLLAFDTFVDARITLSNVLFLLLVGVLLIFFWRETNAHTACKIFVFLVSMAYGAVITITVSALGTVLGFPDITDLRLYSPGNWAYLCFLTQLRFRWAAGLHGAL